VWMEGIWGGLSIANMRDVLIRREGVESVGATRPGMAHGAMRGAYEQNEGSRRLA
jgi:hypothetical protein